MDLQQKVKSLQIDYYRAERCWQSNNLRLCLAICDSFKAKLRNLKSDPHGAEQRITHLENLVWLLKIRCLTEDYQVNESLLLNDDDLESDDRVSTLTLTRQSRLLTGRPVSKGYGEMMSSHRLASSMSKKGDSIRPRTGALTGRLTLGSSQRSAGGGYNSSYRPLTTSLTVTQTAFSRSTRPLLRYSINEYLSKIMFEYLYNSQASANRCPDYRQCLEYLNLVQTSVRESSTQIPSQQAEPRRTSITLIDTRNSSETDSCLAMGPYWLIAQGICYFKLQMNNQAEAQFRQAIKLAPKHVDSFTWLIKIYLRLNQPLQVLTICHEGMKHSKNAILCNWASRVQILTGDLNGANASLNKSLTYCPTNIEALANVGHFSFYSDKLELSLKCFERIQQVYSNTSIGQETKDGIAGSSAELLNNLALCNLYSGFYDKVYPLFRRAFLNSPNRETTSDIWYNMSFIPLSCGFKNLAMACLSLALENNSQNWEASNNLGVLKFELLINDIEHFENRQEYWSVSNRFKSMESSNCSSVNQNDQEERGALFDEAETHFDTLVDDEGSGEDQAQTGQPEMLYNMALIKRKRGQLLACVKYCNRYLEYDQDNYHIRNLLMDVRRLVAHD